MAQPSSQEFEADKSTSSSTVPEAESMKWGTHVMAQPAAPAVHPDNKKAAFWNAGEIHQPYVVYSPVEKPSNNPFEPVINMFSFWSRKAENIARNMWNHLRTGPSMSEAAWGKVNLSFKAVTEGGYESLFKQIFETDPHEKLKKTFACYLSTIAGPVAGTLYLSSLRIAFSSDRPLCYTAPSGQEAWSYYKVMIPLAQVKSVIPVTIKENNPPEQYIQVVTTDDHDFWFMGFLHFHKATQNLLQTTSASAFQSKGDACE